MKSAVPFLMFVRAQHGRCEEAVKFWTSLFKGAALDSLALWPAGAHQPEGTVQMAVFTIGGTTYQALDSHAPHAFDLTPAFSIFVTCDDANELDQYAAALLDGGKTMMPVDNYGFSQRFGWVEDRYGMNWQLNLP